jgi:hypothetical protein
MKDDAIITEVRAARHRISERFGHDTERLAEHYRKLDEELQKSGDFRFVTEFYSTDATAKASK